MKTKEIKKMLKKTDSDPNFHEAIAECKTITFKIMEFFEGKDLQAVIMALGNIILVLEERYPDIPIMDLVYEAHYQTGELLNNLPEKNDKNYIAR